MALSRHPNGPLSISTLYKQEDVVFWGVSQPPDIDPEDTDITYTVKIADRIDLLASRMLGDPRRSWIILHRNNLRLSPNDLVPGQKIYIPTIESLRARGIIV